ncbi:MAG: cysteine peptidase family C39 domain-containing protein, partial [Candidatus Brocadiia bacterium]
AAVALLSSLFLWDSLAACRPADPTPATMDDSGVYRQATSYDCGPAAAVTMLRTIGLPVDESKIAALSLLREGRGVTVLELCRGLDLALQGTNRRAAIRRLDADSLAHCPTPFLAEVRRGPAREHCVVVLEVLPDAVVLGDPARGRYGCLRSEFAREWTGLAITAQPQP